MAIAREHIEWCQRYRGHDAELANYRPTLREIVQSVGCDMRVCGKRGKAIAIAILAAKWIDLQQPSSGSAIDGRGRET